MKTTEVVKSLFLSGILCGTAAAWVNSSPFLSKAGRQATCLGETADLSKGSLHGENACFLPIKQLDQDYYAPRIIQVCTVLTVCILYIATENG